MQRLWSQLLRLSFQEKCFKCIRQILLKLTNLGFSISPPLTKKKKFRILPKAGRQGCSSDSLPSIPIPFSAEHAFHQGPLQVAGFGDNFVALITGFYKSSLGLWPKPPWLRAEVLASWSFWGTPLLHQLGRDGAEVATYQVFDLACGTMAGVHDCGLIAKLLVVDDNLGNTFFPEGPLRDLSISHLFITCPSETQPMNQETGNTPASL